MTVVLFNTWAITFLVLGFTYSIEGRKDPSHWEWKTLKHIIVLSLIPLVAQAVLLGSLWEYGKYYYHLLGNKVREYQDRNPPGPFID